MALIRTARAPRSRFGVGAAAAACAIAVVTLVGCAPESASTDGPVGVWGTPDAEGKPSIEFALSVDGEAAEYSGSDGCNRIGGSYTLDGDTIDLGAMRSTRMFCEGVDTWLSTAQTARLDGDELVFEDASGTKLGSLKKHTTH